MNAGELFAFGDNLVVFGYENSAPSVKVIMFIFPCSG